MPLELGVSVTLGVEEEDAVCVDDAVEDWDAVEVTLLVSSCERVCVREGVTDVLGVGDTDAEVVWLPDWVWDALCVCDWEAVTV